MRIACIVVAAVGLSGPLHSQSAATSDRPIAFEVASVRPVENNGPLYAMGPPVNGTFRARSTTVRWLIHYAYGREPLDRNPLPEGGPSWIDTDRYEVVAQGPPDLTFPDARRMVLTLLRERFNLKSHIEQRALPVYVLVRARKDGTLGPGLRPSAVDCSVYTETLIRTGRGVLAREVGPGCVRTTGRDERGRAFVRGPITAKDLAPLIQRNSWVDRPVIDATGLSGTYNIDLVSSPRPGPGLAGAALAVAPDDELLIFTAVQEQLGLRLESRTAPVDVVVIDSVERPTPN